MAETLHEGFAPSHDFSHVARVYTLAERIGTAEGADLFVVRVSALLHDIGRAEEARSGGGDRHEELGVEMSKPFLEEMGVSPERTNAILHAIAAHRHRKDNKPRTLEAKCLYDADKLDSLGAVGIARSYLWLGEHGRSVFYEENEWIDVDPLDNTPKVDSTQREWHIKLRHLRDHMYTETGRVIAFERHDRMARIMREIEEEVKGG